MWGKVALVWMILLILPFSLAAEAPSNTVQNAVDIQIDQANRYLSAENAKAIEKMKEDVLTDMKAYNDDNFRIFDGRMQELMLETKTKLIVGSLGIILLANGIIAIVMLWVTRNYSYESYLKKIAGKKQMNVDDPANAQNMQRDMRRINEMKNEAWEAQEVTPTLAMRYGEKSAANMSEMNAWQHHPARQGAWVPPSDNTRKYTYDQYADQQGYAEQLSQDVPPQQDWPQPEQQGDWNGRQ